MKKLIVILFASSFMVGCSLSSIIDNEEQEQTMITCSKTFSDKEIGEVIISHNGNTINSIETKYTTHYDLYAIKKDDFKNMKTEDINEYFRISYVGNEKRDLQIEDEFIVAKTKITGEELENAQAHTTVIGIEKLSKYDTVDNIISSAKSNGAECTINH